MNGKVFLLQHNCWGESSVLGVYTTLEKGIAGLKKEKTRIAAIHPFENITEIKEGIDFEKEHWAEFWVDDDRYNLCTVPVNTVL